MKMFVETNAGAGVLVGVGSPANSPQAKITGKTSTNTNNCQTELNDPLTIPVAPMSTSSLKLPRLSPSIDRWNGFASTGDCSTASGPRLRILAFLLDVYLARCSVQTVVR